MVLSGRQSRCPEAVQQAMAYAHHASNASVQHTACKVGCLSCSLSESTRGLSRQVLSDDKAVSHIGHLCNTANMLTRAALTVCASGLPPHGHFVFGLPPFLACLLKSIPAGNIWPHELNVIPCTVGCLAFDRAAKTRACGALMVVPMSQ